MRHKWADKTTTGEGADKVDTATCEKCGMIKTTTRDQVDENERRVTTEGIYPNISRTIRVVLSADLKEGNVPPDALPCGFKGYELLKFSYSENDTGTNRLVHRSGSTGGEIDTEVVLSELATANVLPAVGVVYDPPSTLYDTFDVASPIVLIL